MVYNGEPRWTCHLEAWDGALSSWLCRLAIAFEAQIRVFALSSEHQPPVLLYSTPGQDAPSRAPRGRLDSADTSTKPLAPLFEGEVVEVDKDGRGSVRALWVPLMSSGKVIGFLEFSDRSDDGDGLGVEADVGRVIGEMVATTLCARRERDALATVAQDLISRAEARSQELDRRRWVAEGLRDVLIALNSDRTLGEILRYIVAHAQELLRSDACVLYRLDRDHDSLLIEASAGLPDEVPADLELSLMNPVDTSTDGSSIPPTEITLGVPNLDAVVLNADPIVRRLKVPNEMVSAHNETPAEAWLCQLAHHFSTTLSVPLVVKDETYGTLALYTTAPRDFLDADVSLAVSFGSQAALAIENAQLRLQAEQTAVLQERGRLARDLHDSVTQSLYSLTLLAEAARRLAALDDLAQVQVVIRRLGEIGLQALKEMRLLVYELRPSVLRREGLVRALTQRLEIVEKRAGVETHLAIHGTPSVPPVLEEQLYHVVQEALNNTLKHAAATRVTVRIMADPGHIVVEVEDNGVGFDPETLEQESGMGLVSMRERIEDLGGQLVLNSAPGQGTRVVISLNLPGGRSSHE